MGYIKNLGKGFVRSAVNQVGRDGGKVISNQLYGDAHSTPHRITGDSKQVNSQFPEPPYEYCEQPSTFGIVFRILLAFLFNIIGGVAILIYGITKKQNAIYNKVIKYESVPTYEQDRRYKSGVRYAGDVSIKKTYLVQATEDEEKRNLMTANIYIYSGAAIIGLFILIMAISSL